LIDTWPGAAQGRKALLHGRVHPLALPNHTRVTRGAHVWASVPWQ